MEHRWGERVAIRLTVQLARDSLPAVAGSIENVSSSGAWVRTQGRGPQRGPVEVIFQEWFPGYARRVRLPAYVVRESDCGVGIEWCEFAPRAVRQLMIDGRRAGGARARARVMPASRHFPHEPNIVMQACAQLGASTDAPASATAARQ